MKVFISADIEGVAGIATRNEVLKDHPDYAEFQQQMTREVAAACEAALESGANRVLVKDAHATARNILFAQLPQGCELIRGWSGHPHAMMQGIDQEFDAAIFIGYHSAASIPGNPLSHTMNGRRIYQLRVNGEVWSEFHINRMTAISHSCPVVFVSGDQHLCETVHQVDASIGSFATFSGTGDSVQSIHPGLAVERIKKGVSQSLTLPKERFDMTLAKEFRVELQYLHHTMAYRASFYPGANLLDSTTVGFNHDNYFEVLRFFNFCI